MQPFYVITITRSKAKAKIYVFFETGHEAFQLSYEITDY